MFTRLDLNTQTSVKTYELHKLHNIRDFSGNERKINITYLDTHIFTNKEIQMAYFAKSA